MSAIQYLSIFAAYGWQMLLLAAGVALVTFLLKKTVFKNFSEKVMTFLPFALGIAFFAVYRAIATLSWAPFCTDVAATLEGGFTCGCIAVLCFVACEQLAAKVGERTSQEEGDPMTPVTPLLQGYVAQENIYETATKLLQGSYGLNETQLEAFVSETLTAAVLPETTEAELLALCAVVRKYLSELTGV